MNVDGLVDMSDTDMSDMDRQMGVTRQEEAEVSGEEQERGQAGEGGGSVRARQPCRPCSLCGSP